jgi:hypothetical protein
MVSELAFSWAVRSVESGWRNASRFRARHRDGAAITEQCDRHQCDQWSRIRIGRLATVELAEVLRDHPDCDGESEARSGTNGIAPRKERRQTSGEEVDAFGAKWYVVSPAGVKIVKPSSSSSGGGGGYSYGP